MAADIFYSKIHYIYITKYTRKTRRRLVSKFGNNQMTCVRLWLAPKHNRRTNDFDIDYDFPYTIQTSKKVRHWIFYKYRTITVRPVAHLRAGSRGTGLPQNKKKKKRISEE